MRLLGVISMTSVLEKEKALMEKYRHGRCIDAGDNNAVDTLCSLGLIKTGLSVKKMVETAKTTEMGLELLKVI